MSPDGARQLSTYISDKLRKLAKGCLVEDENVLVPSRIVCRHDQLRRTLCSVGESAQWLKARNGDFDRFAGPSL